MSALVVCAAFDDDEAFEQLRDALNALGARVRDPAHRPHLTLSAAQTDDTAAIVTVAASMAERHASFALELDEVGSFRRGAVVWVAPGRSHRLAALQRDAYETLVAAGHPPAFGRQSRPDEWRPHCTLARRVQPQLVDQLRAGFRPVSVTVAALSVLAVGGRGDLARIALASAG